METKSIKRLKKRGVLKEIDLKTALKEFEQGGTIAVEMGGKLYNMSEIPMFIYQALKNQEFNF